MGNRQSRKKEKIPEDCVRGGGMKATTKVEMRAIGFDSGYGFSLFFSLVVISLLLSFVYIPSIFLWPTDSFGLEPRAFF